MSEACSVEQANEWAVRAIEQADVQMAQHSTRQFHAISTQSAAAAESTRSFHRKNLLPHELKEVSKQASE